MANESLSDDNLCFFITRIGEEGSPEREQADGVMDAIVKPAAKELGMECVRADQLPDPGQITTQIIDRIVGAKMVVADLTGGNPNVYYELAVRNSFRAPAALLAQQGERLPFDTSVMRTVFYTPDNMKSTAAARDDLTTHMKRALEGAVDSPIATAVDLASIREGSPTARQLAEIARSLESLTIDNQEMKRLVNEIGLNPGHLPPNFRRALASAHEHLQAQLRDDPPPLEIERVANMVAIVNEHVNASLRTRRSQLVLPEEPDDWFVNLDHAMIGELAELYRQKTGDELSAGGARELLRSSMENPSPSHTLMRLIELLKRLPPLAVDRPDAPASTADSSRDGADKAT